MVHSCALMHTSGIPIRTNGTMMRTNGCKLPQNMKHKVIKYPRSYNGKSLEIHTEMHQRIHHQIHAEVTWQGTHY